MYNFIFIFFYKLSSKRNPDAKGAAKTFVALATFMHLFLLVSIITPSTASLQLVVTNI